MSHLSPHAPTERSNVPESGLFCEKRTFTSRISTRTMDHESDGPLLTHVLPIGSLRIHSRTNGAAFPAFCGTNDPGLGGEVDNPNWKAGWVGKQAYQSGEVAITIIKGKVDSQRPGAESKIDGLAGATLTARGVNNLVRYWLGNEGFAPFISHLKAGES